MSVSLLFFTFTKSIIWLIGLVTLTALAIRDFLPILDDYRSNNVAIKVGVVVDDGFKSPQLVLCIPFYQKVEDPLKLIAEHLNNGSGNCQICEKLEQKGWDVWNHINFTNAGNETFYHALSLQFMLQLFKMVESQNKNVLESHFSDWNSPILSAAMNFFMWREQIDYIFQPYAFPGPNGPELMEILDLFNNTSTMDMLHVRMFDEICENFIYKEYILDNELNPIMLANSSCRDVLLTKDIPVTFDFDGLWLALPPSHAHKVTMKLYHFTLLENGFFTWKAEDRQTKKPYFFYPDLSAVFASQSDPLYLSYIDKITGVHSSLNVTIKHSVNMRAKDLRPDRMTCQNESSETCFSKCTKLWISDRCGCIPFTYKGGISYKSGLPYCNLAMYTSCNISTIPEQTKNRCLSECKNVCEHISYNWQISYKSYEVLDSANKSEFNLFMIPMVTTFADFAWVSKVTPEQFMSQMGGIVNFYVGCSGLSFFAVLLVIVEFLKRLFIGRGTVNEKNEESKYMHAMEIVLEMWENTDSEIANTLQSMNNKLDKLESEVLDLKRLMTEERSDKIR